MFYQSVKLTREYDCYSQRRQGPTLKSFYLSNTEGIATL